MISQTTEYALRATAALARCGGCPRTGRALAAETRIPRGYLTKVLAPLVRARLVQASRGAGGGYSLGRDPASVALIEVIHAIEPPAQPPDPGDARLCALHRRIDRATASYQAAFADCTLADLAAAPRAEVSASTLASSPSAASPPPCIRCRTATPRPAPTP